MLSTNEHVLPGVAQHVIANPIASAADTFRADRSPEATGLQPAELPEGALQGFDCAFSWRAGIEMVRFPSENSIIPRGNWFVKCKHRGAFQTQWFVKMGGTPENILERREKNGRRPRKGAGYGGARLA